MTTIYNADCMTILKDIPDESIDMVMTSPPYDNLRTYNGAIDQWNFDKFKAIAKEIARILVRGGVCVWVVNDATINGSETGTSFRQALYFKEIGINIHDTMIWTKNAIPYDPKCRRYWQGFEYMFVFSKGQPKTCNYLKEPCKLAGKPKTNDYGQKRQGGTNRTDRWDENRKIKDKKVKTNVWHFSPDGQKTGHPAVYPYQLASDHIRTWTNEEDTVLDPFLGSGTTGIACIKLNRNFIGTEIDPTYFGIAKKRIEETEQEQKESMALFEGAL